MPCINFDLGNRRCVASVFRTVDRIASHRIGDACFLSIARALGHERERVKEREKERESKKERVRVRERKKKSREGCVL